MSPEEEILATVKAVIENDADLLDLLGAEPDTQYWNQEENEKPPYIIYKIVDTRQVDRNSIYVGVLEVDLWFYSPDVTTASSVEDIIVSLFDDKYIYGDTVTDCRLWHNEEGRTTANINRLMSNPGINNYNAIHKCIVWNMRWVAKARGYKKIN